MKTFIKQMSTSKVPWLCIHQKHYQNYQNFGKKQYVTHVTIGSCSMMNWQHVAKNLENSTVWIGRYKHSYSPKPFFQLCKKTGSCTSQAHFSMKKCRKWWCLFEFSFLNKLAICLKKFTSFGIVQHIGKNSK